MTTSNETIDLSKVKKNYVDLVKFLQDNQNKNVKTILPDILEMVESKKKETTIQTDEDGNITHILCWYHKEWEPVEWFGRKTSSHSGFNTMCKVGVNQWTKQQSDAKKAKAELLDKVASGEVPQDEINERLQAIETERQTIIPRPEEQETEVTTEE